MMTMCQGESIYFTGFPALSYISEGTGLYGESYSWLQLMNYKYSISKFLFLIRVLGYSIFYLLAGYFRLLSIENTTYYLLCRSLVPDGLSLLVSGFIWDLLVGPLLFCRPPLIPLIIHNVEIPVRQVLHKYILKRVRKSVWEGEVGSWRQLISFVFFYFEGLVSFIFIL